VEIMSKFDFKFTSPEIPQGENHHKNKKKANKDKNRDTDKNKNDDNNHLNISSEYPEINSEKDLDIFLNQIRAKNNYDPRADIQEDHYLWQRLLMIAEKVDEQGYGFLHGLRCAGCRLKVERGKVKLDLFNSEELLKMYINRKMFQQAKILPNKLKQKVLKKIKKVELKPRLRSLKSIFDSFNKWLNENNQMSTNIDVSQLNNMLADIT
jgi:hypothetical protein